MGDATLYVYHHRENLIDDNFDDSVSSLPDNPMKKLKLDWTIELLDFDRQKEARPVLCQNWNSILEKFGVKENQYEPKDDSLNNAFIETPSKLHEITRKIAHLYKDEGKEQLQNKLRCLEEEQKQIKNNLLLKIMKAGVPLDDAQNTMEKQIKETYKAVSDNINDSILTACDKMPNELVNGLSSLLTPKKIKTEKRSHKKDRSRTKSRKYRSPRSSYRHYSKSSRVCLSYDKKKPDKFERYKRERLEDKEKSCISNRNKTRKNEDETISKIMAGKWL